MGVSISRPDIIGMAKKGIIDYFAKRGKQICHAASAQRNTKPDTWNQQDAYAWGVYDDGNLVQYGFARQVPVAKKPQKLKGKEYWGRELATQFLREEYHPQMAGVTLVILNAMWYSSFHEEGHTPSGRIYWIVSQVYGTLSTTAGEAMKMLGLKDGKAFTFDHWKRQPAT